jgi:hypothetical protein
MTPMLGAALAEDPPPPICPAIDPPVSAAAPPDAGLRAFRDPVTGELRSPTAEELTRAREAREFAPKASQVFTTTVRADGTKSVDLGDAFLFDVVATRAPDGTVRVRCVPRSGARAGSAAEVK